MAAARPKAVGLFALALALVSSCGQLSWGGATFSSTPCSGGPPRAGHRHIGAGEAAAAGATAAFALATGAQRWTTAPMATVLRLGGAGVLLGSLATLLALRKPAAGCGRAAAARPPVAMAAAAAGPGAAPFGCIEEGATDPALFVMTNVALGDKKKDFMQACSKAVASSLSKPESYVAICVQDGLDLIWGGSDAPCALCKVTSLGSINLANNKALTAEVSKLLADFDVPANRIYVNFFDLERENVGYNGATFAG